jgi:hypothetical protein
MSRRAFGTSGLVLLAVCWALVLVPPAANQNAHYATTHALLRGSSNIDREHNWTGDTAYLHGHYFAAKAPGLALATAPYLAAVDALGVVPAPPGPEVPFPRAQERMPATSLWELALWGAVLPGIGTLILVRRAADRLAPGYGTVAAFSVGGASVLGVLATVFFAHSLSAFLGFAAASLLLRDEPPSRGRAAAAGLVAALATVVELPLGIVAVVLAAYLLARWRAPAWYLLGAGAGVVPLLAYNAWAFGSPFTLAYSRAVSVPGVTGHDVIGENDRGFFGVGFPHLHGMVELLFSAYGLLVLAPVWALALAGLVLLWRDGRRWEAGLVAAVAGLFFVYNAGYTQLFGALSSGPRFLAATMPFLALPLAATFRRVPVTAFALLAASAVMTWTMIAANPAASVEDPGGWFRRVEHGGGRGIALSDTVLHWAWRGHRTAELAFVLLLAGVALAAIVVATPFRVTRRDVALALGLLVGWRILYTGDVTLLKLDEATGGSGGALAAACVAAALAFGLLALARGRLIASAPLVLVAPLLMARVAAHSGVALGLALASLAAIATLWRLTPSGAHA